MRGMPTVGEGRARPRLRRPVGYRLAVHRCAVLRVLLMIALRQSEEYPLQRALAQYGQAWGYDGPGATNPVAVYQHHAYELLPGARAFTPAPGGCKRATRCAQLWASWVGPCSVSMRCVDELVGRVWIVHAHELGPEWGPTLWITTERAQ